MVKSLRKRPRPDDLKTQQRKSTNSFGRLIYLGLVVLLAVSVLNFMFGDHVFMRADGLVIHDQNAVATTYVARVTAVHVEAGQAVGKNDALLQLQSTDMLKRLADLSASHARLSARAVDFKIRSKTIEHLLPLATKREHETDRVLKVFDDLSDRALLTTTRYDEALKAKYDARHTYIKLSVESKALKGELKALDAARVAAAKALDDLRTHYSKGLVRASVSGSVGAKVPSVGDVYRPGQKILSVYSGKAYVLVYLPRRYLFSITPGMKVSISNGRIKASGVIEKILPLTDAAPKEFQNSFKPRDRNQLARIKFAGAPSFPLHEKVSITKRGWMF